MSERTVYTQHKKPTLSILICAAFGFLLLPVRQVRIVGIIWIALFALAFFLIKDRILFKITDKAIEIYDEEDPTKITRISLDDVAKWRFETNGKDFDNVVLTLKDETEARFPAIYPNAIAKVLRRLLKDNEEIKKGPYRKEDIDIGASIKSRIEKFKKKYFTNKQ
ncbi:MAG: hypothetical protein IJM15_02110 [Erysipelotrichaceae bacterium]|nr:hypothetical protein [Erysipelotrichaceae bacterium]